MSLRRLLPTLDNAGRRLVLAEVLGQPVSMRHARRRGRPNPAQQHQGHQTSPEVSAEYGGGALHSEVTPDFTLDAKPDFKLDAKLDAKPDFKPDVRPKVRLDVKSDDSSDRVAELSSSADVDTPVTQEAPEVQEGGDDE